MIPWKMTADHSLNGLGDPVRVFVMTDLSTLVKAAPEDLVTIKRVEKSASAYFQTAVKRDLSRFAIEASLELPKPT